MSREIIQFDDAMFESKLDAMIKTKVEDIVNSMLARGEVPAVHGALHAQRALQGVAQPPRMGVGGPLPEYHSILLILQQEISIEDCKKRLAIMR